MNAQWFQLGYLLSAALFIFGLKALGHPRTAPRGNQLGALGMLVAVITVLLEAGLVSDPWLIFGGIALTSQKLELFPEIPTERRDQAAQSAETLGAPPAFPWAGDTHPATDEVA